MLTYLWSLNISILVLISLTHKFRSNLYTPQPYTSLNTCLKSLTADNNDDSKSLNSTDAWFLKGSLKAKFCILIPTLSVLQLPVPIKIITKNTSTCRIQESDTLNSAEPALNTCQQIQKKKDQANMYSTVCQNRQAWCLIRLSCYSVFTETGAIQTMKTKAELKQ